MLFWRGYPSNLKVLLIAMIINSTGMAFLWPLQTIYITQVMNKTLSEAGLVIMLQSSTEIVGSFLGGYLYDRIRGKRTILFAVGLSAFLIFIISIGLSWPVYIAAMIILGIGIGMIFPPIYAMAGAFWKEGGGKSFNLMYLVLNLGVAMGTALGGIVAQYSFRYVFWTNGVAYLVFLSIIWFGLKESEQANDFVGKGNSSDTSITGRHPASTNLFCLLVLCLGFMFCWITYIQWQTSISTYMHQLGIPLSGYSRLWTINGLIILFAQSWLQRLMARWKIAMRLQLLSGVTFFVLAFAVLTTTHIYGGFLAAIVLMTLGEILIFPAVPAIADQMAPMGKKGRYQGIVNGSANLGRTIGPLIGGLFYDHFGPIQLFYSCIFICGFALICFWTYQRFIQSYHEVKTIVSNQKQI